MSLFQIQYKLAMHLIGVHKNAAVIGNRSWNELSDLHEHEHFGPGGIRGYLGVVGIRGHLYTDFRFDEAEIEAVLEEAERELGPDPKRLCPDDGVCGHFCDPGRCFRVMACSPFTGFYPDEPDGHWPLTVKVAELAGALDD